MRRPGEEQPPGDLDRLELELRRLPGVALVSFDRAGESLLVELVLGGPAAPTALRAHAEGLASHYAPGPATIVIVPAPNEGFAEGPGG